MVIKYPRPQTPSIILVVHVGSIPPELGKLVALEDLRLIGNELTGKCDMYLLYRWLNAAISSPRNKQLINCTLPPTVPAPALC